MSRIVCTSHEVSLRTPVQSPVLPARDDPYFLAGDARPAKQANSVAAPKENMRRLEHGDMVIFMVIFMVILMGFNGDFYGDFYGDFNGI